MGAVRINNVGDDLSLYFSEEDKVRPDDPGVVILDLRDAKRVLPRAIRVPVPEPEALTFALGFQDRLLPPNPNPLVNSPPQLSEIPRESRPQTTRALQVTLRVPNTTRESESARRAFKSCNCRFLRPAPSKPQGPRPIGHGPLNAPTRARTWNLAVNSRSLYH